MLIDDLRKKGHVPESGETIKRITIRNYMALFAKSGDLCLQQNTNTKIRNCWIAEHSMIGSMSYLALIAMVHFYPVKEETTEWKKTLCELPEEDKMLYNMVSHLHGGRPLACRPPEHILNSDNKTSYITKSTQPTKSLCGGLFPRHHLQRKIHTHCINGKIRRSSLAGG